MGKTNMKVVLVPGLLSPPHLLHPLRDDLQKAGYDVFMFDCWPTLTVTQYKDLLTQLRKNGPAIVIGHSLGGRIAIKAAEILPELFLGVIGLDSFIWGEVKLKVPYFEARGWAGNILQVKGANEIKQTPLPHIIVPLIPCVRQWVLKKIQYLEQVGNL